MAVTHATLPYEWGSARAHTLPAPAGAGGVLVVMNLCSGTVRMDPVTAGDWTFLTEMLYVNGFQAWATAAASPDMGFTGGNAESGVFIIYRISDGTMTGIQAGSNWGGWWDDAQRTQTLPTLTDVPAGAVGLAGIMSDASGHGFDWSSPWVEQIESGGGTVTQSYGAALVEGLTGGTWVPGTVTATSASFFDFGVVAVGTTGGGTTPGMFKAWTGSEWKGTAKVWTGTEWKTGAKIWTGSEWKAV